MSRIFPRLRSRRSTTSSCGPYWFLQLSVLSSELVLPVKAQALLPHLLLPHLLLPHLLLLLLGSVLQCEMANSSSPCRRFSLVWRLLGLPTLVSSLRVRLPWSH